MIPDIPAVPSTLAPPAPEYPWPDGACCAVFPSFDVDAETAWLDKDIAHADHMVTLSFGGYEGRVGVPRILEYLRTVDLKATFFIPGWVVEAYTKLCEEIVRDGHEVAHHGYLHKRPDPTHYDHDVEEFERGMESLGRCLGVTPVGYRAPGGENYDRLAKYMRDRGVRYLSSLRDDIRPYRHVMRDGSAGPVELPVNLSFDDWLYGLSNRVSSRPMFPKEHVLSIWNGELDQTRDWGGLVTMVLHPQVTGRPMRFGIFRDFIARARSFGDVWLATGAQILDHFEAHENAARK